MMSRVVDGIQMFVSDGEILRSGVSLQFILSERFSTHGGGCDDHVDRIGAARNKGCHLSNNPHLLEMGARVRLSGQ